MKILICCENFYPSIGGVQEVCFQLAKRLVNSGSEVQVATSYHTNRNFSSIKGIKVNQFKIYGNYVRSIYGEKYKYINFIKNSKFDIIFIYAAQQWTLDLILNQLDQIKCKKYLVPCGFSNLYNKDYSNYFELLKLRLNSFDGLIFHTLKYRDYEFCKKYVDKKKINHIENGADEQEFKVIKEKFFHKRKINSSDEFIFMTNGALSSNKGLLEVVQAFKNIKTKKKITLYVNSDHTEKNFLLNLLVLIKSIIKFFLGVKSNDFNYLYMLKKEAKSISNSFLNIKIVNLNRNELIDLYKASDVFIFASKIEYSPLVIFEAMASENAIISHNVGNVKEILKKYKSGILVNSNLDINKNSIIDINDLEKNIQIFIDNPKLIKLYAKNGRSNFLKLFNWEILINKYHKIFKSNI